MTQPVTLLEVWRGGYLESIHSGHIVICDATGQVVEAFGDPDLEVFPRSSCKMLQALPLIESGAAEAHGLRSSHLALACASHNGAAIHVGPVRSWLEDIGMSETALRCGAQEPKDREEREALITSGEAPCQMHNNCSGKHTGFLTLGKHLGAGPEYVDVDHPVQKAVRSAFEDMTGQEALGYGIDGCSAPNFRTTLTGLARAAARMAAPQGLGAAREAAAQSLTTAMMEHPELVAGEGRACTELMRAAQGKAALKTGAEGVFVGILPGRGLGIALKASDGGTRAAEAAIAAMLARYGVLSQDDPVFRRYSSGPILNWRGLNTGEFRTPPMLQSPA